MGETRPRGEQLRFESTKTGSHNLDAYLEAAELGDRTVADLMSDLFDSGGTFRSDIFEFRVNSTTKELEFRVGDYADPNAGWAGVDAFIFRQRGAHADATAYKRLDVVTYNNNLYICTADHTSSSAVPGMNFYAVFTGGLLAIAGGTMTGFITLHADPTSALHASTKQYVDAEIATASAAATAAADAIAADVATNQSDITALQSGKANTSHTHTLADVTDSGTAAALNVPAAGNAAAGEVVKGDDTRLTDARAPTTHSHPISEVTNLQTTLDGKAASSHTHAISEVTNLQTTLDGKAASSHTHAQSEITDLVADLAGKAAASHTHPQSEITNLVSDLAGKAATSHTHVIGDTTGLQTALDGKAASSHSHTMADLPEATASNVWTNTADKVISTDIVQSSGEVVTSAPVSNVITLDMNLGINFTSTITANTTIALPTNRKAGRSHVHSIYNSTGGALTVSFSTSHYFPTGLRPASVAAGKWLVISMHCYDGSTYWCSALQEMANS